MDKYKIYNPSITKYMPLKNSNLYIIDKGDKKFLVKKRELTKYRFSRVKDIIREYYNLKFLQYLKEILLDKNKDREVYNYLKKIDFPKALEVDVKKNEVILVESYIDADQSGNFLVKMLEDLKEDENKFLQDFYQISSLLASLYHFKKNRYLHNDFAPRHILVENDKIYLVDHEMGAPLELLVMLSHKKDSRHDYSNLIKKENRELLNKFYKRIKQFYENNEYNPKKLEKLIINLFKDRYNLVRMHFNNLKYSIFDSLEAHYLAKEDTKKIQIFKDFVGILKRKDRVTSKLYLNIHL